MKTDNNPKNTRRIKNPSHGEWIYILLCANSLCQKTHPVCPQASCTEEPAFSIVFPFHFQSALPALCLETPQTGVSKTCKKSSFYHLRKQKIHQQRILHLIEEKLYDRRLCFKLKDRPAENIPPHQEEKLYDRRSWDQECTPWTLQHKKKTPTLKSLQCEDVKHVLDQTMTECYIPQSSSQDAHHCSAGCLPDNSLVYSQCLGWCNLFPSNSNTISFPSVLKVSAVPFWWDCDTGFYSSEP